MSAAHIVQAGILDRLKTYPFFADFKFRRNQTYQVQPEDLPYCAAYQLPERNNPDGDLNAGEPKFVTDFTIGISVMLKNIDPDELEDALDTAFDVIMIGLLEDPSFIGFAPAGNLSIEGIANANRQFVFGMMAQGSTNETPYGELRLELTFRTRYEYPPDVRDDLRSIILRTAYPSIDAVQKVQQVTVPMDMTAYPDPDEPDGPHVPPDYVPPITTTTSLSADTNNQPAGTAITFTTGVTPTIATGTLHIFVDEEEIASGPASALGFAYTIDTLEIGDHEVYSIYVSDTMSSFDGSRSPSLTQTVT